MLNVSSRWINNKRRRKILNYYYYVENGTWSCGKAILSQSSNNWLSNFMQSYNFTKNKITNKRVKKTE